MGIISEKLDLPLIQHRTLIWQLTVRNIELRHKGSYLGFTWSFIQPLLMLLLYVFVFGFIFGGKFGVLENESRVDYALGIFVGLSIFHFIGEILAISPTIIVGNPNFVKKVVFPLEILPVATLTSAFFHFAISLLLTLIGVVYFGPGFSLGIMWLPVVLLPVFMLALGASWFLAAIGVFFRDIQPATAFLSMAIMFSSAVFYPAASIPPAAWKFLRFNPLIHAIELSRASTLWNQDIHFTSLVYLYTIGVGSILVGYTVFKKLRPAFADVL